MYTRLTKEGRAARKVLVVAAGSLVGLYFVVASVAAMINSSSAPSPRPYVRPDPPPAAQAVTIGPPVSFPQPAYQPPASPQPRTFVPENRFNDNGPSLQHGFTGNQPFSQSQNTVQDQQRLLREQEADRQRQREQNAHDRELQMAAAAAAHQQFMQQAAVEHERKMQEAKRAHEEAMQRAAAERMSQQQANAERSARQRQENEERMAAQRAENERRIAQENARRAAARGHRNGTARP